MKTVTNTVLLLGTLALVVSGFVYVLLVQRIGSARIEIKEAQRDALFMQTRKNNLNILKNLATNMHEERVQLEGLFVTPEDVAGLLQSFEAMGSYAGVPVSIKSLSDSGEKIKVVVVADGAFYRVVHLVDLLGSVHRAVFVDSVNIARHPKSVNWNARISLTVLKRSYDK